MEEEKGFIIVRVYALILNEKNEILLSDEYRLNRKMTKFPGGGLQYGEGSLDCLKREALEEFGQEIEPGKHYYTTDFFQEALFFEGFQLISIYYFARFPSPPAFRISDIPFDFHSFTEGQQSFRWRRLAEMDRDELSFPIDREVLSMLQEDPAILDRPHISAEK